MTHADFETFVTTETGRVDGDAEIEAKMVAAVERNFLSVRFGAWHNNVTVFLNAEDPTLSPHQDPAVIDLLRTADPKCFDD